jgi:hypothetical protein
LQEAEGCLYNVTDEDSWFLSGVFICLRRSKLGREGGAKKTKIIEDNPNGSAGSAYQKSPADENCSIVHMFDACLSLWFS